MRETGRYSDTDWEFEQLKWRVDRFQRRDIIREITYLKAINEAYDEELERDQSVFILGEDIGQHWGAAFGEMKGLYAKYGPKRIRETPISETAIMGCAIGAAATGMRPVAFLFFVDFLGVCWDEI